MLAACWGGGWLGALRMGCVVMFIGAGVVEDGTE